MCDNPATLPNGQVTACRKCKQCKRRRLNDWVGRCIAEAKTAKSANVVTLTYGKGFHGDANHERAAVLTYSDIQKFLKLLRRHGYPVRYFVAGEYGSKKGRAHWHVILYWQGPAPEVELRANIMDRHWPHGFSFWDTLNEKTASYVTKYVAKSEETGAQSHFAMSKQPPLGATYFRELAEQTARQGLPLRDLTYTFPGIWWSTKGNKEVRRFALHGKSAELYIEAYLKAWSYYWPGVTVPETELVDEFLDPGSWKERAAQLTPLRMDEHPPVTDEEKRKALDRINFGEYSEMAALSDQEWEEAVWTAQEGIEEIERQFYGKA